MLNNVVMFFLFVFSSFLYGGELVQGPYKISGETGFVSVVKNNDDNCPIDLVIADNKESYVMDRLCVNGDYPNVRSVFFIRLDGVNHVGIIVTWYNKHQAEGIEQTDYQVMIYKKNNNGTYIFDKEKNNDKLFYGAEDGSGDGSYKFNNALAVKKYLARRYN